MANPYCSVEPCSFRAAEARVQTPVGVEPFHQSARPDGTTWIEFFRTENGFLLRFPGLCDFEIDAAGAGAIGWACPGLCHDRQQHLFVNQVRPLMMCCRGKLAFHGAAIETPTGAIAFLAPSGRGKSTLTATFAAAGHSFLSDDSLVVEADSGGYMLLPGDPSVRLRPDSRDSVIPQEAMVPPIAASATKIKIAASDAFPYCRQPKPLSMAFFLGDRDIPSIEISRLGGAEAMHRWMINSFFFDIENEDALEAHFDGVVELSDTVPSFTLEYPRNFETLTELRREILDLACRDGLVA